MINKTGLLIIFFLVTGIIILYAHTASNHQLEYQFSSDPGVKILNEYYALLPNGEKINFEVSTRYIIVQFIKGFSLNEVRKSVEEEKLLPPIDNNIYDHSKNTYVLDIKSGTEKDSVLEMLRRLSERDEIEYANPFLIYSDGTLQGITDEITVKIKSGSDYLLLKEEAKKRNVEILKQNKLDKKKYTLQTNKYSNGNALQISNELVSSGKFQFAQVNFLIITKPHSIDPHFPDQWALDNSQQYGGVEDADLDVVEAWNITTGNSEISIAVIDEGVDLKHPDIKNNLLSGYDATNGIFNFFGAPSGDDAHGTACAGIISAIQNNGKGISGIAPNCKIIPVRIAYHFLADTLWTTQPSWQADGIIWAYQNGADILSNSWRGGSPQPEIDDAIDSAVIRGRTGLGSVVLFAAGNDDVSGISYPSSNYHVIAVGATNMWDKRKSKTSLDGENWWGSNYGLGLDVCAPGVKISTLDIAGPRGYSKVNPSITYDNDYCHSFNGTSAACPMAAGVMALILSVNPNLHQIDARNILESTCEKKGGYTYGSNVAGQPNGTWSDTLGYGRINAYQAVLKAQTAYTCSGTTLLTGTSGSFADGSEASYYNNNLDCRWLIQPSNVSNITLSLSPFYTEYGKDSVIIYNGSNTDAPIIGVFTGAIIGVSQAMSGPVMLIRFKTDNSNTDSGWGASYTSTTVPCSGTTTLTQLSGIFSDGSGISNYNHNLNCKWLINPPGASSITLTFTSFNTQLNKDKVRIYDGSTENAPLLGTFSGTTIPSPITSTGGSMLVKFISDATVTNQGWDASYTSVIPQSGDGIVSYEYWFNDDDNPIVVNNVNGSALYTLNAALSTGNLPDGLHSFHIRFKDDKGNYSSVLSQFISKVPPAAFGNDITAYEYWFDEEGYNSRIYQAVVPQEQLQLNSAFSTSTLSLGLHSYHIRFKDAANNWSSVLSQFINVIPATAGGNTITAYEYWFDDEYDDKIPLSVSPESQVNIVSSINTAQLTPGLHSYHVRFKDDFGNWSTVVSQFINVMATSIGTNKITYYEYWFDNAYGSKTPGNVTPPKVTYKINKAISASGLSSGNHWFRIRFKDSDGNWSSVLSQKFKKTGLKLDDLESLTDSLVFDEDNNLLIYPNPGSGQFVVGFEEEFIDPIIISVFNINGQEIYRKRFTYSLDQAYELNLESFAPGSYFVRLTSGFVQREGKLIIQ